MTNERFAEWLDEVCGVGIGAEGADGIVSTRSTVEQFRDACIEIGREESEDCDGLPVTVLFKTQRQRGEPRRDLYILDLGDSRLVYDI